MSALKLEDLIKYAISNNDGMSKELAVIALRYSRDPGTIKLAQSLISEFIEIDLWELESLVNSDKFEFQDSDIEVGVKLDD
jgi:hypothetical protein